MKLSVVFAFVVFGLFLFALFGCTGQPPQNNGAGTPSPPESAPSPPGGMPPPNEQPTQPRELRTAEKESAITLSRNVDYGPEYIENDPQQGGPEMQSRSWSRDDSLEIRGKLREIELGEQEREYYSAKYELVDAQATWKIYNQYYELWEQVDGTNCNYVWGMNSTGGGRLEALNVSYAFGFPFEAQGLGRLSLEILDNGSYSLLGSFYVNMDVLQTQDCMQYRELYNGTEEFRTPVVGVYSGGGRIAGSGLFYNYGCRFENSQCVDYLGATGFLVETELVREMTEPNPTWKSTWELNLPE